MGAKQSLALVAKAGGCVASSGVKKLVNIMSKDFSFVDSFSSCSSGGAGFSFGFIDTIKNALIIGISVAGGCCLLVVVVVVVIYCRRGKSSGGSMGHIESVPFGMPYGSAAALAPFFIAGDGKGDPIPVVVDMGARATYSVSGVGQFASENKQNR
jgi:hypothetical protein